MNRQLRKSTRDQRSKSVIKNSEKLTENQTSSAGQTRTSEMKRQDQRNQTSPAGQTRTFEVERPISPISSRPLSEDDRSISPISTSNIDSFSKRYSHIRLPQSYSREAESPRKKERPPSYGSKVESQESQTGSGNNYELLLSGIRRQSSYIEYYEFYMVLYVYVFIMISNTENQKLKADIAE